MTMSKIAEHAGIGRATLYRYFPDVEAVLLAWHETTIAAHLSELAAIRDRAERPLRLRAVLEAFALLAHQPHGQHDADLKAFLHRDEQVDHARDRVRALISALIAEEAQRGAVREDMSPDDLASYCVHALGAAARLRSKAAVRRLVGLTLAGLRPED